MAGLIAALAVYWLAQRSTPATGIDVATLVITIQFSVFFALLVSAFAFVPSLATLYFARGWFISSPRRSALVGAAIGVMGMTLHLSVSFFIGSSLAGPEVAAYQNSALLFELTVVLLSGGTAGLTFWAIAGVKPTE